MKALLPIILLLSLVAPAKADGSCGELAEYYLEYQKDLWDDDRSDFASAWIMAYVSGFVAGDNSGGRFHVPSRTTVGEMTDVVGKYIQAHPEKWNLGANQCVYDALMDTWALKMN